jgi:hypothetical protein
MRHLARILFAALLLVAVSGVADDQADLIAHLDRTSSAFLSSVEGLSEAQLNYRPAEGRWTIAEIAEHIAAAEEGILKGTLAAMQNAPAPEALKDANKDAMILQAVPDRSRKFQAPEMLRPTNRFGSPAGAVAAYKKAHAEFVALAKERSDLRSFAGEHPVLKNLDAHGWILFQSAHVERHTKQIEEVKADPNFPK